MLRILKLLVLTLDRIRNPSVVFRASEMSAVVFRSVNASATGFIHLYYIQALALGSMRKAQWNVARRLSEGIGA